MKFTKNYNLLLLIAVFVVFTLSSCAKYGCPGTINPVSYDVNKTGTSKKKLSKKEKTQLF